jgi:hypothetical protein
MPHKTGTVPFEHIVLGNGQQVLLKPQHKQDEKIRAEGHAGVPFLDLPERRTSDSGTFRHHGGTQFPAQASEFDLLSEEGARPCVRKSAKTAFFS